MLLLDAVLLHPRLSFRLNDVLEGVVGSSGLDMCDGVSLFGTGLTNFWARGPVSRGGFCCSCTLSKLAMSPLVFDLGINEYSPLLLGSDEDMNGETACLIDLEPPVIGIDEPEWPSSCITAESARSGFAELLLRKKFVLCPV